MDEHALFGREEEISALRALLVQAREGHGVTVLTSGPGGIGKTSLLRWIDDEAAGNKLREGALRMHLHNGQMTRL